MDCQTLHERTTCLALHCLALKSLMQLIPSDVAAAQACDVPFGPVFALASMLTFIQTNMTVTVAYKKCDVCRATTGQVA